MTRFVKTLHLCTPWQWTAFNVNGQPINKLTNYRYTTAKCWWSAFAEACFWGLSDVHECLHVHWMPPVGLYRQPPHGKLPHNWLMIYIGHGFSFILWQLSAVLVGLLVGHFSLKLTQLSCCLPLYGSQPTPTIHPYISTCGVDKNYVSKLAGNSDSYVLWRG